MGILVVIQEFYQTWKEGGNDVILVNQKQTMKNTVHTNKKVRGWALMLNIG